MRVNLRYRVDQKRKVWLIGNVLLSHFTSRLIPLSSTTLTSLPGLPPHLDYEPNNPQNQRLEYHQPSHLGMLVPDEIQ